MERKLRGCLIFTIVMIFLTSCTRSDNRLFVEPTITPANIVPMPSVMPSACPVISSPGTILRGKGSILFIDKLKEQNNVLGITGTSVKENLFETQFASTNFYLSPDGAKIAYEEKQPSGSNLIVYDIDKKKEARYSQVIPDRVIGVKGWTDDEKIIILASWEERDHEGIFSKRLIFDQETGKIVQNMEEYHLPGYFNLGTQFMDLAAISPDSSHVIYGKLANEDQLTVNTTLIDIKNNQVIWEQEGDYQGQAGWAKDGSQVVFGKIIGKDNYLKIVSLAEDGTLTVLHSLPAFPDYGYLFRYFSLSPDNRYVHYTLWHEANNGPGYILDTKNDSIREICVDQGNFIEGTWLPMQNLLIYQTQDGEQAAYWLLDVENWKTEKLISGQKLSLIGYTPLQIR